MHALQDILANGLAVRDILLGERGPAELEQAAEATTIG